MNGAYDWHHRSSALGLVTAGVGAASMPVCTIQEGTHPSVRRDPLVRPSIVRTIALVRRRKTTLSPAAQAFYEMLAAGAPPAGRTVRAARPKAMPKTQQ